MSTTLEAESPTAAEEAAAAIEAENQAALEAHAAELERRAAAGQFEESAGITAEQEAGESLTQEQREATAEHDGAPKRKARKPRAPEQGNLAGGWEELIGGEQPSESKVKIAGGAIKPANAPEVIRKGSRHRVLVDLVATGYAATDKLDHATGEISSTSETRTLKIIGAQFLDPEDYIASAEDGTDVAAEAAADA